MDHRHKTARRHFAIEPPPTAPEVELTWHREPRGYYAIGMHCYWRVGRMVDANAWYAEAWEAMASSRVNVLVSDEDHKRKADAVAWCQRYEFANRRSAIDQTAT
jgi:hypothetical protein